MNIEGEIGMVLGFFGLVIEIFDVVWSCIKVSMNRVLVFCIFFLEWFEYLVFFVVKFVFFFVVGYLFLIGLVVYRVFLCFMYDM